MFKNQLDVEIALPVGKTEMQAFMDDLINLSGAYADKTSMEFAIASILIHAPADKGALSKRYFLDRLRKSAANQVASQVFQDIKEAQSKAQEEVKNVTPTGEDTAVTAVSDVKQ